MSVGAQLMAGRRILVTRPLERDEQLMEQVVAAGGLVTHRPAIAFEPPEDRSGADEAVASLASFQWLVLTSPTGVRFFLERLQESGLGPVPETVRFAVVGPGTAKALGEAGYRPDLVPGSSDADGLAAGLAGEVLKGSRVLWVRPEVARPVLGEVLQAAGAEVVPAVFYRTVPHPGCREIAADLVDGSYDGVLFTSPSTFRAVFDAVPRDRLAGFREVTRVAIGKVTAAAMEAAGHPPDAFASEPTAGGVAQAFRAAFDSAPLC